MNRTVAIAPVRKTIRVATTPEHAFEVFTAGIDRWWPKTHGIGAAPLRETIIEAYAGGRWYTRHEDGAEVTVGHVRVWEPGKRFVFSWEISAQWKPDPRTAYASEVEVRFTAEADGTTRVDLEHRDFERMGDPDGATMRAAVDGGWASILELFAREAARG
ncbi:MAG: SRPBCC family protein [Proteobacteria bacterium]|nr:SRPBCC family protein [Pseudomonadota bacterium]